MKAICSFILALAVSSAGAQIRPVESPVSYTHLDVYKRQFFTSLKSGEFVGSAAHSNMRNFHLRFEMYEDKEDPLPIVHPVLDVYKRQLESVRTTSV